MNSYSSEYNLNFLGNETFINDKEIFKSFDINYLPLENLPLSYYNLSSKLSYSNIILPKIDVNDNQIIVFDKGNNEKGQIGDTIYNYIKFNETSSIKITSNINNCSLLLVGGGGGSYNKNGGGGGEVKFYNNFKLNLGNYSIIIGNGGERTQNGEITKFMKNNDESSLKQARGGIAATNDKGGDSYTITGDRTNLGISGINEIGGGGASSSNVPSSTYIGALGITINENEFINREIIVGGGGNGYFNDRDKEKSDKTKKKNLK